MDPFLTAPGGQQQQQPPLPPQQQGDQHGDPPGNEPRPDQGAKDAGMGTYGPDAQHFWEEDEDVKANVEHLNANYGGMGLPEGKMYSIAAADRGRIGLLAIPDPQKVALLQPTEQKMCRWIGLDLPDLLLPWAMFSLVIIAVGLGYRQAFVMAVCTVALCLILSVHLWLRSRGWPWRLLGLFCLASTCVGFIGGYHTYKRYLDSYFIYQHLPHYQNVIPSNSPIAFRDAGIIQFTADSVVEGARSVGYKNGDVYCAAPIIGQANEAQDALRGFWAVGKNCCSMRARFYCDDADSSGTTGGLVLLDEMFGDGELEGYYTAARMAAKVYSIPVPEELRLVQWVHNVNPALDAIWYGASRFVRIAILLFLACPCILALMMFLTKRSATGNIHPDRAKDWEWHATEAAQMDFGPSLNPAAWSFQYPLELRMDLIMDRSYWSGEVLHDYVFHVANTSILVGPFGCHPAHPYTRVERAFFLLLTVAFLWCFYAGLRVYFGASYFLLVFMAVVCLLAIAGPRYVHKKFQRAKLRAELDAVMSSGDPVRPHNMMQLFFYFGCVILTAATCILALVMMQDQEVSASTALADSWDVLLLAFVVDLVADAYGLAVVGSLDDCHELRGKSYGGFFGRWELERTSFLSDRIHFLWREDALHPHLRHKQAFPAMGKKLP